MNYSKTPADQESDYSIWTRAALSTSQADPFCCTPPWQLAFYDVFPSHTRLMIEESAGSAMVFAEVIFGLGEIFLMPLERLWFFGCPLMGPHAVPMFAERLAAFEERHKPHVPAIIISGIRPGGVLQQRLIKAFARSHDIYFYADNVLGAASLAGGLDGYLSRRSGNHRKKLKKQIRLASEKGVYFERVCPSSAAEVEATYARILAVEATSWKGINKCGMAEAPSCQLYKAMLHRLAPMRGGRIMFARHEDRDIGFIMGSMGGNIYRGQQFSYDDNWKHHSIGNLLQVEQIKWLCEEGVKRYDMGPVVGPKMDYKAHWCEKQLEMQTWVLKRR